MDDSTKRFTDRVEDYARYRPSYPDAAIDYLKTLCPPPGPVVDVGFGTGLFTERLLLAGYIVTGLEPNRAMLEVGDAAMRRYENFASMPGTAERLPVAAGSFGMIVAAQSFHWFDPEPTRKAFARALRPGGWVSLIWNNRETDTTPFLVGYEAALNKYCPDYAKISATHAAEQEIEAFFAPDEVTKRSFPNHQELDWDGVRGRMMSSSYVPKSGPSHDALLGEVETLFQQEAKAGTVEVRYQTVLFSGQLSLHS